MDVRSAEIRHPNRKSRALAQFPDLSQFSDPECMDYNQGWVPK